MVFLTFLWFSGCLLDIIFPLIFQCFSADGHMFATKQLNIPKVLYVFCALGRELLFIVFFIIHTFKIRHKNTRIYNVFGLRGNCSNHCFFLKIIVPTFLGTLQKTGHWPRLGAHLTASVAPQRLAGAPCSPVGDVFHVFFIVNFEDLCLCLF